MIQCLFRIRERNYQICTILVIHGAAIALKPIITRLVPRLNTAFLLKNIAKVGTGLLMLNAQRLLIRLCAKYEELKADDGIPNKKELLKAFAIYLEKEFELVLKNVRFIENFFSVQNLIKLSEKSKKEYEKDIESCKNVCQKFTMVDLLLIKIFGEEGFRTWPLVSDLLSHYLHRNHPSDLRRAMRLRKRIKELEKQSKTKINQ